MPFAMSGTVMDREISREERTRRVWRQVGVGAVALAAGVFILAATVEWLRPSARRRDVQIARVERGTVEATIQAHGTVVPRVEQVVSSPVEARLLQATRRAGDRVHPGDPLLTLDTAGARLDAERLAGALLQKESELTRLRLRLDEEIATLEAQLQQRKLDAEIFHYAAVQKQKLRADGLIAEQEALAASAAARKSDIEISQIEAAIVRARRSREVQLATAQSDVGVTRREHGEARRQLDLAMMRAEKEGVVTWILSEEGATVRRGDIVARIADLSAYRVEGTISDVHAARLSAGMPARVTFSGRTLRGRIDSVDPRIVDGVVRFHVALDEPGDAALRNQLRVEIAVVTATKNDAVVVRRGSLGRTGDNEAFVVREDRAVRTPMRFGLAGDETIEITAGAGPGDQIVISELSEFEGIDVIRLK